MATLEELVVRIRADAAQLEREMKRAGQITEQTGGIMGRSLGKLKDQFKDLLPAITVASIAAFGKSAIDAAGRLKDLGDRIGFAASTLSALEPGLAATGSSVDDFAASMNLLNNQLGEAAKGNEAAVQAFDQLGLSVRALQQLSPEEQFYAVADALGKLGTQYEQTEAGRALFGRGFASLIPLIKESNGNLSEFVGTQKEMDNALSDETIRRIDDFGDALSNAGIRAKNAFLEAFAAILGVLEKVNEAGTAFGSGAPGSYSLAKVGVIPQTQAQKDFLAAATPPAPAYKDYGTPFGPSLPKAGARGSNAGLIKTIGTGSVASAPQELSRDTENALRRMEEANRIIERNRTAGEILEQDSRRAVEVLGDDQEQLNRELQRSWSEYVSTTDQSFTQVEDRAEEMAVSIRKSLANSFEEAIFDAENFGDSVSSVLDGIARQIARNAFIDPLSDSITGSIKGSGLLDSIGGFLFGGARAGGGPVAGGMSYLVGEKGPELFTPTVSGAITPNDRLGGVTVHQSIVINPGVQGAMRAEIMNAMPMLVAASKNAVMEARQRGGSESRLLGGRN